MSLPPPFRSSSTESSAGTRDRAELLDLYRIALDEYRFQVTLNWNRTQYYLVLNAGLLALGVGTLHAGDPLGEWVGGGLFLVGAVASGLSVLAVASQHAYYREVRAHKRTVEERLELGELAIRSTPGMRNETRSGLRRLTRVTTLVYLTLAVLGVLNLGGLLAVVAD